MKHLIPAYLYREYQLLLQPIPDNPKESIPNSRHFWSPEEHYVVLQVVKCVPTLI